MDEPPRKRRKTSSPVRPPSSPLRKPPRRPSFASPTKASLARNYPTLLPTRTSPRQDIRAKGQQAPELFVDGANSSPEDVEESSKRLPRAFSAPRRSPLAEASSVQQNQPSRPAEEALDTEGQKKGTGKPPLDPVLENKKQERARLQREVEELEAHVSRCTKEIQAEQKREANVDLPHAQRADLIKFIVRVAGEDAQEERPTPVSSLLCSFLPFSALTIPPTKQSRPEKPIASHQPVELKDPLPYLEMFTSFSLSTQPELPKNKLLSSSSRVHQKHTIDISGPQKLLTTQLVITIDCLSNELVDMHVIRLPSWAERELGTFMRAKAKERDLGNACWAIDSFWDIATKRAQYWHRCEKAFARLHPQRTIADTDDTAAAATESSILSRKDLSRHLGRDTLFLQDKHVLLKINWCILFDLTGEAESNVKVECAVPAVWKEADASGTFDKVPETFDLLCQTKGVFEATRIMVALLFSQ